MVNFTIRNIPDSLHHKIKRNAKFHHRSLNSEFLVMLESVFNKQPELDTAKILAETRALRKKAKGFLTAKEIQKAKEWGRP